jgi:hypothetical protein
MNALLGADRASDWRRLKALVLDSVSSPITRRVYNLGLDEFIAWFTLEPRPAGFTKATVTAWRVALEARRLGPISINVRITAVRKLAVEAADNGLLAPELASGIARIKGVRSHGVRVGNWLSLRQAQTLLNTPDVRTKKVSPRPSHVCRFGLSDQFANSDPSRIYETLTLLRNFPVARRKGTPGGISALSRDDVGPVAHRWATAAGRIPA